MKFTPFFLFCFFMAAPATADVLIDKINNKKWIHGAPNCDLDNQPPIDILALDKDTYILRQNKCTHYEAPFIYVLFGSHTVFVQDTGATADSDKFPLFKTIETLIKTWQTEHGITEHKILVTHSHGHSDHIAGDIQFAGHQQVILVKPNSDDVNTYFGFNYWPSGEAEVDLGGRLLTILPLPGHQKDALAVLDHQTNIMLTGDSFYPGRLYVRDWPTYKASIQKLLNFSIKHHVTTFLGTHIEMTNQSGKDYVMGSTYQPEEASLVLSLEDLKSLNEALDQQREKPRLQTLDKVIIYPVD